jgi:hypothetical protein
LEEREEILDRDKSYIMEIVQVIEKYLSGITSDEFHRFKSWDNCFEAFKVFKQTDNHSLELAFYLASWGMYRGSSGLLQKNHLIHKGAVDIIFSKTNQRLKCNRGTEVSLENVDAILEMKRKLADYYGSVYFTKGAADPRSISPTDTLISKIILGTLSCVPAYDRYFIDGLKEMKMTNKKFNEASLKELFTFVDDNKSDIEVAQKKIMDKTKSHYPVMKVLDMYFWQIGYDRGVLGTKK